MKIIKLAAENIQRLKAVEITPSTPVVKITGKNNQGKTSVLDSIMYALAGTKSLPEQPIRQGESKAHIRVELDDGLVVTRTFTPQKSYLKVETQDGSTLKSPQAVLDKLVGKLSFDPLVFAQASPKTQRDWLLHVAPLAVDLDQLAAIAGTVVEGENALETIHATYQKVYDDRTLVNRDLDRAKKLWASLPEVASTQPVSVAALLQVRRQLEAQAKVVEAHNRQFAALSQRAQQLETLCAHLRDELAQAEADWTAVTQQLAAWQTLAAPDFTAIDQRLANAEALNQQAQAYAARQQTQDHVAQLQAEADRYTARLQAIDEYQHQLISQASFPIEGLGFTDTGVEYEGVPFAQASSSQKLRVSLAMAMALNPTLRVIRVSDGNLLDSEHLALIERMAQEQDYQLWIELIEESGTVGIYIEEGEVRTRE